MEDSLIDNQMVWVESEDLRCARVPDGHGDHVRVPHLVVGVLHDVGDDDVVGASGSGAVNYEIIGVCRFYGKNEGLRLDG